MTTVAVIGLGRMGAAMARRLLSTGHDVVGWNRTPERAQPLVELGARAVSTPAEAAAAADALITMVGDADALRAVTEGADGVAAGAAPGLTVLEMSTVGPAPVRRLAGALPHGVELLDAPVLGSVDAAGAGTLEVLVGGPRAVVARRMPLLTTLGHVHHVGPLGAGAGAKLVANAALFGVLATLGETLALAESLGLARATAFDVLAATPLAAQAERRRAAIERADYPPRFALSLARKDAALIAEARPELRLLRAAAGWLADAEAAGAGEADYTAVLGHILDSGSG
jgi:3-hydroxyisobutyrate dehydrogenase-like beta-hydroxyacid dehydrogenase